MQTSNSMENAPSQEQTHDGATPVVYPHVPFPLPAHHVFGGFWVRFAAITIDYVCMAIPCVVLVAAIFVLAALGVNEGVVAVLSLLFMLIALAWTFGYFILFYGIKSTTPGKMLFGMRVVREDNGGKMSWGQAFGRTFSYILSRILYIGFIIAAFDDEKRALHDHLAKTRVIRDTRKSMTAGWVLFGIISGLYVAVIVAVIALIPARTLIEYDGGYYPGAYEDAYDFDYNDSSYDDSGYTY